MSTLPSYPLLPPLTAASSRHVAVVPPPATPSCQAWVLNRAASAAVSTRAHRLGLRENDLGITRLMAFRCGRPHVFAGSTFESCTAFSGGAINIDYNTEIVQCNFSRSARAAAGK